MPRLLKLVIVASGLFFGCSVSPLGTCTATSNNCTNGAVCDASATAVEPSDSTFSARAALIGAATFAFGSSVPASSRE